VISPPIKPARHNHCGGFFIAQKYLQNKSSPFEWEAERSGGGVDIN